MNTSLLTRCQEVATDEQIRTTLHELLEDEVRHAQLGWAHLAVERAAGRGDFLARLTAARVGGQRRAWISGRQAGQSVFRGLDAMGVDIAPAREWLRAHVSPEVLAKSARI